VPPHLKMYPHKKIKLLAQGFQKFRQPGQTDRQTDGRD